MDATTHWASNGPGICLASQPTNGTFFRGGLRAVRQQFADFAAHVFAQRQRVADVKTVDETLCVDRRTAAARRRRACSGH